MSALVPLALVALFFPYTSMGRTFVLIFGTIFVMFFVYWVGRASDIIRPPAVH